MELNLWAVVIMDSQDRVKVGDCFKYNWGNDVYAQIINIIDDKYLIKINNEKYLIQINNENTFYYIKSAFLINYTFDQKLTELYLIKNIIE